jgi:O-antigen ligase
VLIQLGLLLYCVLLYIRPGDWVPQVLNWPLEFTVLGMTAVASGVRAWQAQGEDGAPQTKAHFWLLVLWLIAIFASNLTSGLFDSAVEFTILFFKKAVIAVTFWFALNSLGKMRWLLMAIVTLTAALAYQGIYQKTHGFGWAGQPLYWDNRICWVGLWDGANVLSLLFVIAMPFVFEMVIGAWNWFVKLLALTCGALIITGLVLAASRGGWLALGVIVVLYFKRRAGKVGVVLGPLVLAALLIVAPSRLSREDERDEGSTKGRIDMWAEGFEMFKYNPVFGIGKGQFVAYTSKLIAHNAFVQNMGETGSFGLFAWVGLIYASYKSLRIVRQAAAEIEDKRIVAVNETIYTSLTGYLAASMFISTDFDLLYLMLGLAGAMPAIARRESGVPLQYEFGFSDVRNIALCIVGVTTVVYAMTAVMSG